MLHEIIALIGGIGSIVLLVVVITQTSLLKKQITDTSRQTQLANSPYIAPRFVTKTGEPILHLKNVGRGSAINVNIKIKSPNGKILGTIDRFAFLPDDLTHNTHVNLEEFPTITVEGTYYDISETQHKINKTFTYPPSRGEEDGISD